MFRNLLNLFWALVTRKTCYMYRGLFQGNIQDDTRMIATSVLPVVTPGTARVARDVITQVISLFDGGEQTDQGTQAASSSWTCPRIEQQTETPQRRNRSLGTLFPVDSSVISLPSRPANLDLPPDVVHVDAEDMATVAGSNEACVSVCFMRKENSSSPKPVVNHCGPKCPHCREIGSRVSVIVP
jgi:hypothetical protein